MRDWKVRDRVLREARTMARQMGEPVMVVTENGHTFPRPARKALAMAASERHPGLVLGAEVDPS